jgi:threonine synthase
MAKQLGFDRAVIASTGNAGVACAAMGAAGGVGVAVVLDPGASAEQRRLVELLGAQVVVPDGDGPVIAQAGSVVSALVRSHRFAPCTIQGTFAGPANPYGVEGYKTIAFELVAQLGRVPDRVCVPTAAGDALYGIYKGFRELAERGLTDGVPRMTACQPAGAGFVAAALSSGASTFEPVVPDTFAISIGDPSGSTSILEAVRSSGGTAWTAGDEALLDAMALMARSGVIAEGASAAPVAALAAAAADCADELVVAVVTGSGLKWQDQLEQALVRRGRLAPLPGDAAVVAAAMS